MRPQSEDSQAISGTGSPRCWQPALLTPFLSRITTKAPVPNVIDGLLEMARNRSIPVTVDPKFRHFDRYRVVAVQAQPERAPRRPRACCGKTATTRPWNQALTEGLNRLQAEWNPDTVLLTLSERGAGSKRPCKMFSSPHIPGKYWTYQEQETP